MKRLFWSFSMAIGAAIGVWLFARRRMDDLYGEISRLREVERKHDGLVQDDDASEDSSKT